MRKIVIKLISFLLRFVPHQELWKVVFRKTDNFIPEGESSKLTTDTISSVEKFKRYLKHKEYILTKSLYGREPQEQNFVIGRIAEIKEMMFALSEIREKKVIPVEDVEKKISDELSAVEELNKLKLTKKS